MTARIGLPHLGMFAGDTFILLDGGWRVLSGQRPHVDFFTPWGPVHHVLVAVGLKLAQSSAKGLAYETALSGLIAGLWTAAIVRRRFRFCIALPAVILVTFFAVAPYAIGTVYSSPSYAMQYNRYGYVLTMIMFFETLLSSEPANIRPSKPRFLIDWGGISSGFIIGVLLYLKITFFTVSVICFLLALLPRRRGARYLAWAVLGFLISSGLISNWMGWNFAAMWSDLSLTGAVRGGILLNPVRVLTGIALRNFGSIWLFLGLSFTGMVILNQSQDNAGMGHWWIAATAIAVLAMDFALIASNGQRVGFPLTLAASLVVVEYVFRNCSNPSQLARPALLGALSAIFIAATAPVLSTASDTVSAWADIVFRRGEIQTKKPLLFTAPPISGLVFFPGLLNFTVEGGQRFVAIVNEGTQLLEELTGPSESIACLWGANPFSFALQRPNPKGGSIFYITEANLQEKAHMPADRILGDAKVVIYPKPSAEPSPETLLLLRVCDEELRKHFHQIGYSEHWVLMRRN
jgi:hypothetical protein